MGTGTPDAAGSQANTVKVTELHLLQASTFVTSKASSKASKSSEASTSSKASTSKAASSAISSTATTAAGGTSAASTNASNGNGTAMGLSLLSQEMLGFSVVLIGAMERGRKNSSH
ncbi:hypothetical protein E2C01_005755 [Portunus trituberculatus]|uniref:Uncharacterized protein n=1 Tax=Portunus trituberculatus TaxID=210409 RepID=A0A5B7CV48_PORTR|nr:hypothetical protein [Portunus trituberculatus]